MSEVWPRRRHQLVFLRFSSCRLSCAHIRPPRAHIRGDCAAVIARGGRQGRVRFHNKNRALTASLTCVCVCVCVFRCSKSAALRHNCRTAEATLQNWRHRRIAELHSSQTTRNMKCDEARVQNLHPRWRKVCTVSRARQGGLLTAPPPPPPRAPPPHAPPRPPRCRHCRRPRRPRRPRRRRRSHRRHRRRRRARSCRPAPAPSSCCP